MALVHPTFSQTSLTRDNGSISPPRPRSVASSSGTSSSSSTSHASLVSEQDLTVTASRLSSLNGRQANIDDIALLAISSQMTEISYSISDIQTRIFEIQELRHQDLGSSQGPAAAITSGIIDQALIHLDERLESVAKSISAIDKSLEPLIEAIRTPKESISPNEGTDMIALRKHSMLLSEWETAHAEAETLRDELKEDKWLAVFRNASEQADGMMSSLEKAVTQCHEFIWQVHRRGRSEISLSAVAAASDKSQLNMEVYNDLVKSFEAKKKYYIPSTTKVLSVLDKGVRDRVTKNGECLRRHADMRARWRNLRDRIARIDAELEGARKALLDMDREPSENGSTLSRATTKSKNGTSRTFTSTASTISRSMSPFRKLAARMTGGRTTGRATPVASPPRTPGVDTAVKEKRSSFFAFRSGRPSEHASQPVQISGPKALVDSTKGNETGGTVKPKWNSSTKVEIGEPLDVATIKQTPRRPSSRASQLGGNVPNLSSSLAGSLAYPRNASRLSHRSGMEPPQLPFASPRNRPQTPSQIPLPTMRSSNSEGSQTSDDDQPEFPSSLMQRALSPAPSSTGAGSSPSHGKRRGSISFIPVPTLRLTGSRAASPAFSNYRPVSPALSASSSGFRSQTPELAVRARAEQVPFYQSTTPARPGVRPHQNPPPSSFKDAFSFESRPSSRPSSRATNYDRAGAFTPSLEQNPVQQYIPSSKDPLDVEVARVVNGMAHGFLIERLDPPLRTTPPPGAEIKAQYAISNALSRKVVTCRLVVISRSGSRFRGETEARKVMCRVGGGWLDLHIYLLNHQTTA